MSITEIFPTPSYIILLTLEFSNIFAHKILHIILRHYALLTYTQVNTCFFTNLSSSKIYYFWWYFKIKPRYSSVGRESACNSRDLDLIRGLGRASGEGNGNALQYSCLENPMDKGAWLATDREVTRVRHDSATKANHHHHISFLELSHGILNIILIIYPIRSI